MIKGDKIEIRLGETGVVCTQNNSNLYLAYKNIIEIKDNEKRLRILLDSGSGVDLMLGRDIPDEQSKNKLFFDIISAKENFYKKG